MYIDGVGVHRGVVDFLLSGAELSGVVVGWVDAYSSLTEVRGVDE